MNSGTTHADSAELTRDSSDWLDKNQLAQRDEFESTQGANVDVDATWCVVGQEMDVPGPQIHSTGWSSASGS